MSVDVKLYFQLPSGAHVAHRWLMDEANLFDALRERLESLCVTLDPRLNSTPLRLSVSWDDGEDWCTLSGPRSLAEALATNRELGRRPLKLRAAVAKAGDVAFSRDSEAGSTGARERAMSDGHSSLFSDFSAHSLASHVADLPPSPSMKAAQEEVLEAEEQRPPPVEIEDEKSDEQPESALLTPASARSDALLVDAADEHASDDEYVRVDDDEQRESAGSSLSSSHGSQSASAHLQAPLSLEPPSSASSGPGSAPFSATSSLDLGVQTSAVESASLGTSTDELRQSTEFATQTTDARQATPIPTQTESDDADLGDASVPVQVDEEVAPAESATPAPHVDETAEPPVPFEISDVTGHAVAEAELAGSPEPRITQPAQEAEAQIDDVTGFHEHVTPQDADAHASEVTVDDEVEEEQKEHSVPETQKSPQQAASTPSTGTSSASSVAVHRGITCDGCSASPLTGVRYHCTMCVNPGGFDLCERCETAGDQHPHTHVMLKMRTPAHIRVGSLRHLVSHATRGMGGASAEGGSWRRSAPREKPKATFISDVTLCDDVQVHAGETLRKVWSIQNTGSAPWPQPTRLVFVGGDLEPNSDAVSADRQCATVPFAGPGDVVHVSLELVVPDEPGRFRSTFRLQAPDGTRFGPRVWISIVVPENTEQTQKEEAADAKPQAGRKQEPTEEEEPQHKSAPVTVSEATSSSSSAAPAAKQAIEARAPASASPASSVSASGSGSVAPQPRAVPAFPYGNQLAQLRSMGFSDSELCRYLLLNNQGDVQKVVAWLLNNTV